MSLIPQLLVAANLCSFLLYGGDKWLAIRGGRRIPEAWLLGSAMIGLAGAWGGVWAFRHKRRKRSFLWKLWLVTLLEAGLIAVLSFRSSASG